MNQTNVDEAKMRKLFAMLGGNYDEFKNTPLCQGIFDERPSISMTDYKNSANDKLRFFDTEDACKDEWNEILHYWELAAAKDNHFRLYMPKPYFLEVFNRGKKYRLYRLNIA